jgi:hypothetical protein
MGHNLLCAHEACRICASHLPAPHEDVTVTFRISPELAEPINDAATDKTQTELVVAAVTDQIRPLRLKMGKLKQVRSK